MPDKIGHYTIVSQLGRGGMGVVYKGHEESLNRFVAIKVLGEHLADDADFLTRFVREAQAAAALSHPNITQIFFIGEDDGLHYFVMEYVSGRSLHEMIRSEGRVDNPLAAQLILQSAEGLAAAHDQAIIHRDIKPANLMLTERGLIKIADFGLALPSDSQTRLTATGMLMGTPGYLAPEQCRNEPVDNRTDIYALGVTYYELLTGAMPFKADSPLALLKQILDEDPPDIGALNPTVDEEAKRILSKMIEKDREQRYQDCHELVADLESYIASQGIRSKTQGLANVAVPKTEKSLRPDAALKAHADHTRVPDAPTAVTPAPGSSTAPTAATPVPGASAAPTALTQVPDNSADPTVVTAPPAVPPPPPVAGTPPPPQPQTPPAAPAPAQPAQPASSGSSSKGLVIAAIIVFFIVGGATAAVFAYKLITKDPVQLVDAGDAQPAADVPDELTPATVSDSGDGATTDSMAPTEGDPVPAAVDDNETTSPVPAGTQVAAATPVPSTPATTGSESASSSVARAPVEAAPVQPRLSGILVAVTGDQGLIAQVSDLLIREISSSGLKATDAQSDPETSDMVRGGEVSARQLISTAKSAGYATLVVARIDATGERRINYMGRSQIVYGSRVSISTIDLATARPFGQRASTTLEYSQLNADRKVESEVGKLARQVANALKNR